MSDKDEKEYLLILKILSKTGLGGNFSLTALLHEFDQGQKEFATIKFRFDEELDNILLWFIGRRTELCAKLGATEKERHRVGQIIGKINLKHFSDQYPESVKSLNKKLKENELTFVAQPLGLEQWKKIIHEMNCVHAGIVNIYLYLSSIGIDDIVILARKFFRLSSQELLTISSTLEEAYKEFLAKAPIIKDMEPIAREQLTRLGHLRDSLAHMQVLHLGQILYREMLAAKNVFDFKQNNVQNNNPSDSVIRDHIATGLVEERYDEL